MGDLTKNLSRHEFACKCRLDSCDKTDPVADFELVTAIQAAVDHFSDVKGQQLVVIINSAYRCAEHNKAVGGKPGSRHLGQLAADLVIPGIGAEELADFFEELSGGDKWGIAWYPVKGHVHLDVRSTKARW